MNGNIRIFEALTQSITAILVVIGANETASNVFQYQFTTGKPLKNLKLTLNYYENGSTDYLQNILNQVWCAYIYDTIHKIQNIHKYIHTYRYNTHIHTYIYIHMNYLVLFRLVLFRYNTHIHIHMNYLVHIYIHTHMYTYIHIYTYELFGSLLSVSTKFS